MELTKERVERSQDRAKSILQAFKNGVVPDDISAFHVGRLNEINEFNELLKQVQDSGGMTKFIVGEYGSGKSFMLREIQELAWKQRFVMAKIQLEKGFRLNNFQNLYYQIMHSLTTSETEHHGNSFQDLFNLWIDTLRNDMEAKNSFESIQHVISTLKQYNLSFSRALMFYIRARIQKDQTLADAVTSWLTGEQNIPSHAKKNFEVVGHIDNENAVQFLKAFIKLITLLVYKSLVILIDEVDLIVSERSDIRLLAYQNIRSLIDNCYNEQLSHCLFTFGATKKWMEDEEKGSRSYNALYQRIGYGSDASATGDTDVRQPVVLLQQMTLSEREQLIQKVVELYKLANGFTVELDMKSMHNWMNQYFNDEGIDPKDIHIRLILKNLVDVLDIMEQNPESELVKPLTTSSSETNLLSKCFQIFKKSKRAL